MLFVSACGGVDAGKGTGSDKEANADKDTIAFYAAHINRHIYSGRQDSVIIEMTPHFYRRSPSAIRSYAGCSE